MSLIAWYPLNGTLIDNCGGEPLVSKNATYNSSTESMDYTDRNPDWVNGKTGKAWSETDKYIRATSYIPKLKGKQRISITFWANCRTCSDNFGSIINFNTYKPSDNTEDIFRFESFISTENVLYFSWFNNRHLSTDKVLCTYSSNLNTWCHIALVMTNDKCYGYYNGHLQNICDILHPNDNIYFNGKFYLGDNASSQTQNIFFDGSVSNIKIYDHELSQKEVLEDYKQPILHYTFASPIIQGTTNIKHTLMANSDSNGRVQLGSDDFGTYFTKSKYKDDGTTLSYLSRGLALNFPENINPGKWYTWSIDLYPTTTTIIQFDTNGR